MPVSAQSAASISVGTSSSDGAADTTAWLGAGQIPPAKATDGCRALFIDFAAVTAAEVKAAGR